MDDAIKKVRQLAASALARKEKLEEQLTAREAEKRQKEADREVALSADDDEVALGLTQQINELTSRVELKRGEVDAADSSYRDILGDLRSVQDAAKEHERLAARAPIDKAIAADPFDMSAEDAALDNVRRHIDTLSAQADLDDELGASRKADRELEQKMAAIEKQEAEAKARAQLAELKAKRKPKETPAAAEGEEPPKKPKKTM
jgi:phage shock protein A